jgi:hypothetical protein
MTEKLDPRRYPDPIKECWATHEALRTLGFEADDIYVSSGKAADQPFNPPALFLVLKTQGKEFVVTLGLYDSEKAVDEAMDLWSDFAERFNDKTFSDEVMAEIFEASNVGKNKALFATALLSKGFKCPFEMS